MINYTLGFIIQKPWVVLLDVRKPGFILDGKANGIGGKMDQMESPVAGIVRETEEETGLTTHLDQWRQFGLLRGINNNVTGIVEEQIHCMVYMWHNELHDNKPLIDSLPLDHDCKEGTVFLANMNTLPKNIVPNLAYLLPLALADNIIGSPTINLLTSE